MAALVVGFGMSVTSCSDDDDDKKTPEQQEAEAEDAASKFWNVVGQLTSMENYTEDYKGKTFDATIGEEDAANPLVRIVATNDMATAARRFAYLIDDMSVTENTSSFDWSDPEIGSMHYTKTTSGSSLAEVEVNISALPRLQKIIYKTPAQMGTNASFPGNAYYHFGDIVSRTYKDKDDNYAQKTEYWVCVRPPFGLEGKGDSHWMCISPLPKKNVKEIPTSTGNTYALPTCIGKNEEHMQNFAEMLYAILNPQDWWTNVTSTDKLDIFYDFSHDQDKLKYHNQLFWTQVDKGWQSAHVYELLFGEKTTPASLNDQIKNKGLNLLYSGYSWWKTFSWNLTLYRATYKVNTTDAMKKNMHDRVLQEVKDNCQPYPELNVVNNYTAAHPYLESDFFGKNSGPHYIIRYSSGKDLAGFKPDVYSSLKNGTNGIMDVYNYNMYNYTEYGEKYPPQEPKEAAPVDKPTLGTVIGLDGKYYASKSACQAANTTPAAMVIYVGNEGSVEDGRSYSGLALALDLMVSGSYTYKWIDEDNGSIPSCTSSAGAEDYRKVRDGIMQTEFLAQGCGKNHNHPAAKACINYDKLKDLRKSLNASNWFMASTGQWQTIYQSLGHPFNDEGNTSFDNDGNDPLYAFLKSKGVEDVFVPSTVWTTTEDANGKVVGINVYRYTNPTSMMNYFPSDRNTNRRLMAMFAF